MTWESAQTEKGGLGMGHEATEGPGGTASGRGGQVGGHLGGRQDSPPTGVRLLHDPALNKGTAFTEAERDALGLRGLLPPHVSTQELQVQRVLENLRRKDSDLEKYIYAMALADRNQALFYRVLMDNLDELMPIVYTPTVGRACQEYAHILRGAAGLFLTARDAGRMEQILSNWPQRDVRVIVVTDGERILGLGDLGADGMGIPVGKLALYTACAGVDPRYCLPITIDVGTDNEELRGDPLYIGLDQPRLRGPAYDELLEEFIQAATAAFPGVLIQLEDFGTGNAFRILQRYRDAACLYDDDIQGTAAVAVAGLCSALRITGVPLAEQRVLFAGAGEAGIGIASLLVQAMVAAGMTGAEARQRCWFVDSQGLVAAGRERLAEHKLPYAHDHAPIDRFEEAVRQVRPTALIGVSGQPGMFTQEALEEMARLNRVPIVFALSNPTSKAECTAQQAYGWTGGRAIFASGSPFAPVQIDGRPRHSGQGNNAYIFPGVGLAKVAFGLNRITDEMFLAAAQALAAQVEEADLATGSVFPPLTRIRAVSARIAAAIGSTAYDQGVATATRPADLHQHVLAQMYDPRYQSYV